LIGVGIDIGGTFTDLVLLGRDGRVVIGKVLTTPRNPADAVHEGFLAACSAGGITAQDVTRVVHGTTLVTNAVLERKGVRTALIATEGFRDTLEIATEHRYDMYDLEIERPEPLVPRKLRFEVQERIYSDGTVGCPLDTLRIPALADALREAKVEAIAVSLINAYENGEHERLLAQELSAKLPEIPICISSEVNPEIREYHRSVTTAVNAYVLPIVSRYVAELAGRLRETGFRGDVYLMLSNGGICTVDTARRFPVRLIESGPAAGALMAAEIGRHAGYPDLLSFDMGGTTAKACYIEASAPLISPTIEVAHVYRFKAGSGLPLQLRAFELIEIGAGGGSIARVDDLGLVRIGPDSAGSDPGPVCYGRGGTTPTVTDADLLLGYLSPEFFLGGKMSLDAAGAAAAVEKQIAKPLGLSTIESAYAIHRLVNENMASAARVHAIARGKNPSTYPLLAFGGAGPVHAVGVAHILGVPQVIVPLGAGVASATGLLMAPFAFDFVRSYRAPLDAVDWDRTRRLFGEMEAEGREIMGRAGLGAEALTLHRLCALRYVGQGSELEVELTGPLSKDSISSIKEAFEAIYSAHFGAVVPGVPVEVLTWRLSVAGPPHTLEINLPKQEGGDARKGERQVYFGPKTGWMTTAVYNRYALRAGARFNGPAIIEERESTTVVDPDAIVDVDAQLNLVVTLAQGK
jgi:N-methylhydantoinase A